MALGAVGTLDYAHSRAGAVAQRASPRVCVDFKEIANFSSHFFSLYCNFVARRATNVANDRKHDEHARVGKRVYADDPRPPSDHLQGLLHLHNGRLHD